MTRLKHIKQVHQLRKETTANKILAAVNYLKTKNMKITIVNVAKTAKISRNTVSNYKHLFKQ